MASQRRLNRSEDRRSDVKRSKSLPNLTCPSLIFRSLYRDGEAVLQSVFAESVYSFTLTPPNYLYHIAW